MRALLGLLAVVLLLALVGWVTFSSSDDGASVKIETDEIQQDTERLVESGKDLIDDADAALDAANDDERPQDPEPARPEPAP